ncbi:hypothetical protein ACOMHN_033686 [Nucella lapillus]
MTLDRVQAVDPDWLTHREETPLLLAARSGHYSCLRALLNAKANVSLRTKEGLSPLYEAIVAQSNECIRLLVKKGAVVNHAVYTGFTPLHQAAIMGSAQVAAYLLQQGALQTVRCHHGLTPLFLAAQSGSVDTVRILLSRLQEVGNASDDVVNMVAEDGATPLLIAAQEGHDDLVDLLLKHGANPNSQVTSLKAGPLQYAVYCQRHKCVRKLLAVTDLLQFDGDFGCMHPLVQALRHADTAILRHLLGAGVDPRGARPLDPEQGEELRDLTEGVVGGDWTAGLLCHLPAQGGLPAARLLLDRGLDPNAMTPREVPPLLVAMACTHRPLFRLLFSRGARPNVYDSGQNITMLGALFCDLQGSHVGEVGGPNASGEGVVHNASGEGEGPGEPMVVDPDGGEERYRWMEPAKQSFLLPLWAAGGEVETMLSSPVGDGWSLLSLLTLTLAPRPLAGRQAAAAALLTLLLGMARGVETLPQDLLALVALDQAKELTTIAGEIQRIIWASVLSSRLRSSVDIAHVSEPYRSELRTQIARADALFRSGIRRSDSTGSNTIQAPPGRPDPSSDCFLAPTRILNRVAKVVEYSDGLYVVVGVGRQRRGVMDQRESASTTLESAVVSR